jgi:hypothetical protein
VAYLHRDTLKAHAPIKIIVAGLIAASLLAGIVGRLVLTAIVWPSKHQALGTTRVDGASASLLRMSDLHLAPMKVAARGCWRGRYGPPSVRSQP